MAVWRRKPKGEVLIHSDQGSQFTRMDWAACLRAHNLEHSMSRRGNCHDRAMGAIGSSPMARAVAESFFNLLKRERIRRRTYRTREDARQDVFDYIEMFYNPKRKHARNGMLSPAEFKRQQMVRQQGVQETRGYSAKVKALETALIEGKESREPQPFDFEAFKKLKRAEYEGR